MTFGGALAIAVCAAVGWGVGVETSYTLVPPPGFPLVRFAGETRRLDPQSLARPFAAQSDAVEIVAPRALVAGPPGPTARRELEAAQPRVDWASLLPRTFEFDVKTCPLCAVRLEVRAVVTAPGSAAKILERLARPRAPPRAA